MKTIVFTGAVIPERSAVHVSELRFAVNHPDFGISGEVRTFIWASKVSAIFIGEDNSVDLLTLKNLVQDVVHFELDMWGFFSGCGYDVEISQAIDPESGASTVFGADISTLATRPKNYDFVQLFSLAAAPNSDFLRRCLADFREAIRNPKDTGELCYRGIEALRKYFTKKFVLDDSTQKGAIESWERMRDELGLERSQIDEIGKYAVDVRHGGTVPISDSARATIFTIAWDIADAYIAYALNGYVKSSVEDTI